MPAACCAIIGTLPRASRTAHGCTRGAARCMPLVAWLVSVAICRAALGPPYWLVADMPMQKDSLRSCTFGCAGALRCNIRDLQHFTFSAVACRAALGRPDNRGYAQRVHGCVQASAAERNPPKLLPSRDASPGADVAPVPAQRGLAGFNVRQVRYARTAVSVRPPTHSRCCAHCHCPQPTATRM